MLSQSRNANPHNKHIALTIFSIKRHCKKKKGRERQTEREWRSLNTQKCESSKVTGLLSSVDRSKKSGKEFNCVEERDFSWGGAANVQGTGNELFISRGRRPQKPQNSGIRSGHELSQAWSILGKWLNHSVPQFLHLYNGNDNRTYLKGCYGDWVNTCKNTCIIAFYNQYY